VEWVHGGTRNGLAFHFLAEGECEETKEDEAIIYPALISRGDTFVSTCCLGRTNIQLYNNKSPFRNVEMCVSG